jgi:YesN/AraC family two-component response regulator
LNFTFPAVRILEAGSAAEAMEILLMNDDIDVLMTDVRMPGEMDGLDLVALMRAITDLIQRNFTPLGNAV